MDVERQIGNTRLESSYERKKLALIERFWQPAAKKEVVVETFFDNIKLTCIQCRDKVFDGIYCTHLCTLSPLIPLTSNSYSPFHDEIASNEWKYFELSSYVIP